MRRVRRALVGLAALLAVSGVAHAGLATDDNGPGMDTWRGTAVLEFPDWALGYVNVPYTVEVEYCTYAVGYWPSGQSDPRPSGAENDYLYAYQVMDVANEDPSDAYVTRFKVDLDPGGDGARNLSFIDGTGDVDPIFPSSGITDDVAGWTFNPAVYEGQTSSILYFTSPYGPEWGNAMAEGGGELIPVGPSEVPKPVPEPATLALLIGGGCAVLLRRRR